MPTTLFSSAPAHRPRRIGPGASAWPKLALVTVLAAASLYAAPAHAQGGPPPGYGGPPAGGWTAPVTTVTGGTTTFSD